MAKYSGTKISLERIGDVIDTPQESNDLDKRKIPLPLIKGEVKYENVSFSFESSARKVSEYQPKYQTVAFCWSSTRQSGSGKYINQNVGTLFSK